MTYFRRVLIANRGEIACRIIRTLRRLGIESVAVYSDADRTAQHVRQADRAIRIGPPPARESYLCADKILAAAKETGADAIHPGYGFLSENADFAEACERTGIRFIGPPASAIRAMGSKSAAKALMERAGVPLLPGYHGAAQDAETLRREARRTGFPLLLKAAAGGGGKGIRLVETEAALPAAIAEAQEEASRSFADATLLIEKFLPSPRHVEVQVFGDAHGQVIHLFDRDCSIQRRRQKVIEEAPAPNIPDAVRAAMGAAAVKAAQTIGYQNAGTIEFLYDQGDFYFMEMNTRLQVEHPVTEAITGQDLVEWQLRVAAGHPLPLRQDEVKINGAAIEARICAEEPEADYRPAIGTLALFSPPPQARLDTGFIAGDRLTVYYDSLLAKLIVHAENRAAAVTALRAALAETFIHGLNTNLSFLRRLAAQADFAAARLDTGFIPRNAADLLAPAKASPRLHALLALAHTLRLRQDKNHQTPKDAADPFAALNGFSLHQPAAWPVTLAGYPPAQIAETASGWCICTGSETWNLEVERQAPGRYLYRFLDQDALADDPPAAGSLVVHHLAEGGAGVTFLCLNGRDVTLTAPDPFADAGSAAGKAGDCTAPMSGTIAAILVKAGDKVASGTPLIRLEAMKMLHTLSASHDGTIADILVTAGQQVTDGARLVTFKGAKVTMDATTT